MVQRFIVRRDVNAIRHAHQQDSIHRIIKAIGHRQPVRAVTPTLGILRMAAQHQQPSWRLTADLQSSVAELFPQSFSGRDHTANDVHREAHVGDAGAV